MGKFYFLAILFMVFGCQDVKYPEKPENLIAKDKMIDVMTEVYLSNASRGYNIRTVRDSGYKLDSMLYKKFAIDSMQFAKSHAFYAGDFDAYAAMFEKVKLNLEKLKVEADTLKAQFEKRRRIKDSLRRDSLRIIELLRVEDSTKRANGIAIETPVTVVDTISVQ